MNDDNAIEQMTPAPSDGLCEDCERRPGTRREEHPYHREISGDRRPCVLCDLCHYRACQDI